MLNHAKQEMYRKALEAHSDLGEDEELGPADLGDVKQYVSCLNQCFEAEPAIHIHGVTASGLPMSNELQDTRLRFLNGKSFRSGGLKLTSCDNTILMARPA